ncbi:MAG: hypothetical protein HKN04_00915 [Rhodothermaceae bacterium]|nr:hypothetical protein [Rhodothermaceae bacterium]
MRVLFLAVLILAAGCGSSSPALVLEVGSTTTLRGTVVSVNLERMAVDGDGVITIETEDGATARVFVAARMNLCAAEGLDLVGDLVPGDRVEAQGLVVGGTNIRPCDGDDHYLRRADG